MTSRSGSSAASDAAEEALSDAEEEHKLVTDQLQAEADAEAAKRTRHRQGKRAVSVLDASWGAILSSAVQQLLHSSGDQLLAAATFSLPEKLTLREAAKASRSALWMCILTSSVHAALDAGCTGLARNVRRALRRRLVRLPQLPEAHKAAQGRGANRPDSLVATLHFNWGSMLMAATGRPLRALRRGESLSIRALEARVEALDEQRRAALASRQRARSAKRAKSGLAPTELVEPDKTPRQKRMEMHERKLGIFSEEVADKEPQTDDDDEHYGIMARVDMHLRRQLLYLTSPLRWVRQAVVLSLSSVHGSSLLVAVHAACRLYEESRGKQALALQRAQRNAADEEEDANRRAKLPGFGRAVVADEEKAWAAAEDKAAAAAAKETDAAAARREIAAQLQTQRELTRLMRQLAQHRGMASALDTCPDLLRQVATFVHCIAQPLFAPADRLLRTGVPNAAKGGKGGLLDLVDPNSMLPWCLDYLALVAAVSDAVCRRRDLRQPPEFASLMSGATEAAWPVGERFELYSRLKLWSSHGAGEGIKRAEEVELNYRLADEEDVVAKQQVANSLERGARRRMLYAHWAISQLMAVGPLLPLSQLSEEQLETEFAWAAEGERVAQFVLLRPLLVFHFDVLLPIYLVYSRSPHLQLAALYHGALFMPVEVDAADTCPAVHFIRMTASVAEELTKEQRRKDEKSKAADRKRDPFVIDHERNVATVLTWGLLSLLSPEVVFRKDAAAALYTLADALADATPLEASASGANVGGLAGRQGGLAVGSSSQFVMSRIGQWPSLEDALVLLSSDIYGLGAEDVADEEFEELLEDGIDDAAAVREQPSVEDVVRARLGETNGRVRSATDLHVLVHKLSHMLAKRLPQYSGAMLSEVGNAMLGLMNDDDRQFSMELLLPWARQLALLEPVGSATQYSRARQGELRAAGFCIAYPSDCLQRVLEYTLHASVTGLPEIVATFWRTLALAAPALKAGMPPLNIAPAAAWVSSQTARQTRDRDKQTCKSLALFIKGLAIRSREEEDALREAHANARKKGASAAMKRAAAEKRAEEERERRYLATTGGALSTEVSKCARAIALMQRESRQRREKSSRRDAIEAAAHSKETEERTLSHHLEQIEQIEQKLEAQQSRVLTLAGEALVPRPQEDDEEADDPSGVQSSVELRGGLGMRLRDGRKTTPARVQRMSLTTEELGVPNLNLEKALARARARDKVRSSKPPSAVQAGSGGLASASNATSDVVDAAASSMPNGDAGEAQPC